MSKQLKDLLALRPTYLFTIPTGNVESYVPRRRSRKRRNKPDKPKKTYD